MTENLDITPNTDNFYSVKVAEFMGFCDRRYQQEFMVAVRF